MITVSVASIAVLWLSLIATALSAPSTSCLVARGTKTYCLPSQPCWPKAADWNAFNATISGRLIKVTPWADPCFTTPDGFDLLQCTAVKAGYTDGTTRGDQVGTTQTDNWSYCATNAGPVGDCSLVATTTGLLNPLPISDRTCALGRISPYAVSISDEQDAVAAFAFAKKFNIKVTIKNTGHEYLGRSTSKDSLMLWTHNLKSLSYQDSFLGQNAVLMGAGVIADDAYKFASLQNRVITLGAYASVGVGGGFAMGGGHGPLQPKFGLAVDNLLQFTVVTPDGQIRTANANTNSDLFWAMRGGGGGTWGLVTQTVYQVYPNTPLVTVLYNLTTVPTLTTSQKQAAVADFISEMAKNQVAWTKMGWAGYNFFTLDLITFTQFLPSGDLAGATASMADMITYMQTNKNFIINVHAITLTPTFEAARDVYFTAGASETPVAYSERLASRLIPYQSMSTLAQQQQLGKDVVSALVANENNNVILPSEVALRPGDSLQIYSTGPTPADFGGPSGADTGLNTAWRSSVWEIVINVNWVYGMSQKSKNALALQTSQAANVLRKYGTGTYFSEADVLEPNWQTAFFGNNYAKLLTIKEKYDPNSTLIVYKGIGYAGQENQSGFQCYQQA
ncbi:hypothetical protein CBS101457_004436 [Exobasidium rhododendri]|nr:hypothetical protein CBS101457_004436 [Exobasidium rhododendri]